MYFLTGEILKIECLSNLLIRKVNANLGTYLGSCEQLLNSMHTEISEDIIFIVRTALFLFKLRMLL